MWLGELNPRPRLWYHARRSSISQSNHKTQVIWNGREGLLCYSPIVMLPKILRTVGSLIVCPRHPFFKVRWMLVLWFRFLYSAYYRFRMCVSGYFTCGPHCHRPYPPPPCVTGTLHSHILSVSALPTPPLLLPLTIVRTSRLCSEQYVLAFGVSFTKLSYVVCFFFQFVSLCKRG
jgi:hypothetical protein